MLFTDKLLGYGRNNFDRDYTAILYSHAFRRLKHKTQVFFYTQNDHVCTRLDHSLYVSAISEVISNNLKINGIDCEPTLAKTIGIGHDLGHAPFGHTGEKVLNELSKDINGFNHEKHSLRIVDKIEKPRNFRPIIGLNLTLAVRDGIVNHCGEDKSTCLSIAESPNLKGDSIPFSIDGCIVRLVDKVSYLGRDLEDAVIAGMLHESDIPGEISTIIGSKNGEIVDFFVRDIIENSTNKIITLSNKASILINKLMAFNKEIIYQHDKLAIFIVRATDVLTALFERFMKTIKDKQDRIDLYMSDNLKIVNILGKFIGDRKILYFDEETHNFKDNDLLYQRIAIDFLSTLTDSIVFQACSEYFLPKPIV